MSKLTIFLARHSQKLALAFGTLAIGITYGCQPYYEVCCRWSLVQHKANGETRPSDRILRAFDEVCGEFGLSEKQKAQLDIFLMGGDQPVALGSLVSKGYAFIGLPACAFYSDTSEIPTDALDFYTPHFPYGPFSVPGQRRLELMVLPDDALRFLIARELLRLGACTADGASLLASARSNSVFTMTGIIGSLYAAYQVAYVLNRRFELPLRWMFSSRLMLYMGISLVALLCQWQVMLAWRRHNCLRVDEIVASLNESFLRGGVAYYTWRLRLNQFWHEHILRYRSAALGSKKTESTVDVLTAYQDEQRQAGLLKQENAEVGETAPGASSSDTGYFLPRVDRVVEQTDTSAWPVDTDRPMHSGQFQYSINPRTSSCGNERWAGDGEPPGFGLTALLSLGRIAPPMAWFFGLFCYPATSHTRLQLLEAKLERWEKRRSQTAPRTA
ncbi:hypothetical protein CRM22_002401 [Opisthorchis felineus]|uniref:Transmembrane protein 177 n=1 Tax=Opisthorchis felineus TaxID=147828 RepID=A0A4V3SGD3_OPIFE|nr:hypothetical protein CRM22_002401 [Opisthorchis felineus]